MCELGKSNINKLAYYKFKPRNVSVISALPRLRDINWNLLQIYFSLGSAGAFTLKWKCHMVSHVYLPIHWLLQQARFNLTKEVRCDSENRPHDGNINQPSISIFVTAAWPANIISFYYN